MELYNENIARLIERLLLGVLSEGERRELEMWVNDSEEHDILFNKIKNEMRASVEGPVFYMLDDGLAWQKFKEATRVRKKRVYVRNVLRYAAAIMFPVTIIVSSWFLVQREDVTEPESCPVIIRPGEARAVLLSADGDIHELNGRLEQRIIEVEKGIVVKQGGGNLSYDSLSIPMQDTVPIMNTLMIPRGGEFKLTLSDGTVVYLNSASELKYPIVFNRKERKVFFSGEAYFDVARDPERPFYVVTDEMQIQVYGTEFNVNTHRAACIQTVLVDGRIGIKRDSTGAEIVMKPGELARFDRVNKEFDVKKVDVRQYIVWKDGYFTFENETLEQIMSTLSLWYNVDVIFVSEASKGLLFTGYMRRYDEIDKILDAITDVVGVRFEIRERTIMISE